MTRSEGSQEKASSNEIEDIFQKLDEEASQSRLFALQELEKQNDLLANRKIASLDIYFLNRISQVRHELETGQDERILRMKNSELEQNRQRL